MIVIKLCILIIDAIHISLLMRFCRIYIGEYKINKKSVSIFFVALWLFNSFMRGTVQGLISSQDAILFFDRNFVPIYSNILLYWESISTYGSYIPHSSFLLGRRMDNYMYSFSDVHG